MGKWMDLARVGADPVAVSALSAESPPKCAKGTNCNYALPGALAMGLHRLAAMPCPRLIREPAVWREVVGDALRLRDEGWLATALAMGWTALDLFGVADGFESVAVELRNRPVIALLAAQADHGSGAQACFVLDDGDGRRAAINRRQAPKGAALLWELK